MGLFTQKPDRPVKRRVAPSQKQQEAYAVVSGRAPGGKAKTSQMAAKAVAAKNLSEMELVVLMIARDAGEPKMQGVGEHAVVVGGVTREEIAELSGTDRYPRRMDIQTVTPRVNWLTGGPRKTTRNGEPVTVHGPHFLKDTGYVRKTRRGRQAAKVLKITEEGKAELTRLLATVGRGAQG